MSDDAFKALEADITTLLFDRPWPADREAIVRLELKLFALGLQEKVPGKPDHAIRRLGKSQKLDLLITFSGLCGDPLNEQRRESVSTFRLQFDGKEILEGTLNS